MQIWFDVTYFVIIRQTFLVWGQNVRVREFGEHKTRCTFSLSSMPIDIRRN